MGDLYEELKERLKQEKGVALATVVRGEEHVGAKLLVLPDKSTRGTLGNAALDALVVEDVVVIDARSAFATRERFPHADELIVAWPDEVLERMELYPSTSVAVLTHDPKFDEPTLKVVLSHQVGYVGAVGSRKTKEERDERLRKQGLAEEQIRRIHGPIGLNIGATSPEEMALAIMAEIVATRHGKDAAAVLDWTKKSGTP